MKIYSTKFKGLKIIKYNKYRDERGDVIKIFNKKNTIFKINCFESYLSFSKKRDSARSSWTEWKIFTR